MDEFSELLRRARAGDRDAVAALYRAYGKTVARAARTGLGPSLHRQYDTVDISQSVFGDMLRELSGFEDRGEPAFRRWLLTKVRNKLHVKARRQMFQGGRRREEAFATESELPESTAVGDPAALAGQREDEERLGLLLGGLGADEREVIGLYVDEELPWAEIARRLGLRSPDAARMRFVRAVATLRQRWTQG